MSELLALLLGTAEAPGIATDLLARFGSLYGLARARKEQLMKIRGIGETQAARLVAVLELSRRLQLPPAGELSCVTSPADSVETKGQSPAILSIPPTPTPLQGAVIMTNQSQTQTHPPTPSAAAGSTRIRIYSYLTKSRFLHIEDSLQIGKVRLFGGTYRRNEGMSDHGHHFLDIADARVIFTVLATGEANFSHKEYKGTAPVNGRATVSRVLSVVAKGENVY